MGIVNTEFYTDENGVEMRKDTYANGTVVKIPKSTDAAEETSPSDAELLRADMDYLKMMKGV